MLSSEDVPENDKIEIKELLKRNPYVFRHSAITEKSGLSNSDSKLRQFAGWTARSNMHYRYVHFRGGESMNECLLKVKGIIKDDKRSINILKPKISDGNLLLTRVYVFCLILVKNNGMDSNIIINLFYY